MKAKWFKALCGLAAAICAVCASALPVINGSALTYMSWFTDKEEVTDYAYSFAVIGDPQYVTMNFSLKTEEKQPLNLCILLMADI